MESSVDLGLKSNWRQFTLLIVVNAFVGGMVGLERTIFPEYAEQEFGISSNTAILSFIIAFGITKAIANYFTGRLANSIGRKNLLVLGWIFAIPIPFLLIHAPSWNWIVLTNVLLGINQGLTWSSTVVMKIDLVGPKNRGLAMGLNEFSGYLAVGIVAFLSGYVASQFGITPYPFYIGMVISWTGLLLSIIWVKDTRHHVAKESLDSEQGDLNHIFWDTTLRDRTLSSITQAGLVNNLNDGMVWGLLPILLFSLEYNTTQTGVITALYPAVWGVGQLFTGKLGDHLNKKKLLLWGMLLQGIAIVMIPWFSQYFMLAGFAIILGIGTALVYPTFLSAIADTTSPVQRAESLGTFRLWRDLGYAIGALLSGIIADLMGIPFAIGFIGILTLVSALVIQFRMPNPSSPR